MKMTAEDRVQRAWEKLTLGPGWEARLSVLMAEEIEDAIAEVLANAKPQSLPTTVMSEGER